MSDQPDESQKTEEATPRKLEQSRKKGQVASSQEIKHLFILFGGLVLVALFLPWGAGTMIGGMQGFFTNLHRLPVGGPELFEQLRAASLSIAGVLALPLAMLVVLALLSGLMQHGLLFSTEQMKPKIEKISPIAGFKRQFSMKAMVEFAKGIAKITIVGAVLTALFWPQMAAIDQYIGLPLPTLSRQLWELALLLLAASVAVMVAIAGVDYLYQRYEYLKQQRMTKQEVKDEYKQAEGDPMVKARLRQIRMERAQRRMMADVPSATVVVTNPTHFAVAMRYEPEDMAAPKVVAKGVDTVAFRIREVAEEHDIPIIENPPLARALHAAVDLGDDVPPEHYKAVAEVISFVFRQQNRTVRNPAAAS